MILDVEKLKDIAVKHGVSLAEELVVELAFPALQQVVKESSSPIDDVILSALEAPLKKALLDALAKLKA
jgi:hypothetical protein